MEPDIGWPQHGWQNARTKFVVTSIACWRVKCRVWYTPTQYTRHKCISEAMRPPDKNCNHRNSLDPLGDSCSMLVQMSISFSPRKISIKLSRQHGNVEFDYDFIFHLNNLIEKTCDSVTPFCAICVCTSVSNNKMPDTNFIYIHILRGSEGKLN